MASNKKVDWGRIESEWRAGVKSIRQMAEEYNVDHPNNKINHTSIPKHFKKLGIDRSLTPAIREKAEKKLEVKTVNEQSTSKGKRQKLPKVLTDLQIVDKNATILADLQLNHRQKIGQNKRVIIKMLEELDFQTDNQGVFERLHELVDSEYIAADGEVETKAVQDYRYKLRQMFERSMGLGNRVDTVKKLTEALRSVIDTERKIWGIDSGVNAGETLESGLDQLKALEKSRRAE